MIEIFFMAGQISSRENARGLAVPNFYCKVQISTSGYFAQGVNPEHSFAAASCSYSLPAHQNTTGNVLKVATNHRRSDTDRIELICFGH